jgi:hypothetical protein
MAMLLAVTTAGVLSTATPASAVELPAGCTDDGHSISAWAYYVPVDDQHQWYEFQYRLWGSGTAGKSNVNIRVRESQGYVAYRYFSPDSVVNEHLYTHNPPYPVYTVGLLPEWTQFEAIFDERWVPDPDCSADTATI